MCWYSAGTVLHEAENGCQDLPRYDIYAYVLSRAQIFGHTHTERERERGATLTLTLTQIPRSATPWTFPATSSPQSSSLARFSWYLFGFGLKVTLVSLSKLRSPYQDRCLVHISDVLWNCVRVCRSSWRVVAPRHHPDHHDDRPRLPRGW